MSEGEGGGEKSRKATPRRLRDARRLGQVASSRDLTRTTTAWVWVLVAVLLPGPLAAQLAELTELALDLMRESGEPDLVGFAWAAAGIVLSVSAAPIAAVAIAGVITTRLQTGPVFAVDRVRPKLSNLDPVAGFKRLFSASNLVETIKGIVKTLLIFAFVAWVIRIYALDLGALIWSDAIRVVELDHHLHLVLLGAASGALLVISVADWLFQRFDFLRRLRMSHQEVRREHQSDQGDPQLRSQRRRLQRQWSAGDARLAARNANALIVNPTHIAVALYYDSETMPVPVVDAMGEGELALQMRKEAETFGVPIMRSVALARQLYFVCEDDEEIPERFFDAVAEVLAWAASVRESTEAGIDAEPYRAADGEFDRLVEQAS